MAQKLDLPKVVSKKWGSETWIFNENLCLKRMIVLEGKQCSMHFHKNKEEIFYILSGTLLVEIINTHTGEINIEKLSERESILIKPFTPHRFTAIDEEVEMLEFSTHHEDDDSYRVIPGDSQK